MEPALEKVEFDVLAKSYEELRAAFGKCPLTQLKKASPQVTLEEFVAHIATNDRRIKFMLDLAGGEECFLSALPPPPAPGDQAAADSYANECLEIARLCVEKAASDECFLKKIEESVVEFATRFTGKITHSGAAGAFMLDPDAGTSLPHLSSRSLKRAGIFIPFDQIKLDTSKLFTAIAKIMNGDPVALEVRLPDALEESIKKAVLSGVDRSRLNRPERVDYRLRQVLLPTGGGYISVTPLASPGLMAMTAETKGFLEGKWKQQASIEAERGQDNGKDSAAKPRLLYPRFEQLGMPYGGGKPQNISIHQKALLQNPLFFAAPQRSEQFAAVTRFLRRRFAPFVRKRDIDAVSKHLDALARSLGNSNSLSAIEIYATGALAKVAMMADRSAKRISELLALHDYGEDGCIENVLKRNRKYGITDLDECIAGGSFGEKYRKAMSEEMAGILWRRMQKIGGCAMDNEIVRKNAALAIEKVLEGVK